VSKILTSEPAESFNYLKNMAKWLGLIIAC